MVMPLTTEARATPATLTLTDAATLVVNGDRTADDTVREALAYAVSGDVWQGGTAWRGPRPTGNDPGDALVSAEIRRGLAAANLAGELAARHVAGCLAREPTWSLPALSEEDQDALTAWWDKRGIIALLRDALTRALCGDVPVLRLLIPHPPEGRPGTLADALDLIAVERLDSATARVLDDAATGLRLGVAVFDAAARTLDGLLGRAGLHRVAEIVYPEGGATMLRLTQDSTPGDAEPVPLPLGGRMTMYALDEVPPLLTMSLCGIQGQLTLTLSCMGRNTVTAGFVERVILNATRPVDADGNALPYRTGPGIINWLVGIQTESGPATPNMFVRDPSPPEAFVQTAAALVYHGHKEARQLHALIAGDATASGESRRQAAADFEASLGPSAREVERAVRWLLETVYALARHLQGSRAPDGLRASVTVNLSAAVPTVEEIKETREGVGANLLSRARYQAAQGVDDPAAEDAEIRPQPSTTETPADGRATGA